MIPNPAAQAAQAFFQRHAPEAASIIAPYLERLFASLSDGHSFIWLNSKEVEHLEKLNSDIISQGGHTPLILQGHKLFLGRTWQLERDLAHEIARLAQAEIEPIDWLHSAQNIATWFAEKGSEGQRDAAALALLQPFMLICGGPGTGKTTTVAKLLALLCSNSRKLPRIGLAAPTGKAAAHMARALHNALSKFDMPSEIKQHLSALDGQTVHRLLKLMPPQMQPHFHAEQPLPLDILIIDEASMLDLTLMLHLLRAVPSGCRVVLLGDENQLPSVGAGAVLAQLSQPTQLTPEIAQELGNIVPQHQFATSEHAPVLAQNIAHLHVSHRFGDDSGIGSLARAVVSGNAESAWAQFAKFPKVLHIAEASRRVQAEQLYQLHSQYWQAVAQNDPQKAFAHQADIVVLAAWREDAKQFNQEYTRCLQRHQLASTDKPWFAGQIIMIERNDYPLSLFNGDIGIILRKNANNDSLAAYFPNGTAGYRAIPLSRLPAFSPAFAMTVHKSQGSEYQQVWLLSPSSQETEAEHSLNQSLLYTAITRARESFTFWGTQAILQAACNQQDNRRSALYEAIVKLY